jgi:peptidyl-prolyl cis-trans isomerase-like 3
LALAASGYYDGCIFHRVIKGFLVQTGDPNGTGKGGDCIWGGKFEDEIKPGLKHTERGVVSMANSGKDTNGSQFFITLAKQSQLDGQYTVFGKVVSGWEVLNQLESLEVTPKKSRPLEEVKIKGVKIHVNPIADR